MSRTELLLRNRDVLAGLLFILLALVFGFEAIGLPLGTTIRMGPGYFPLLLSGGLGFFGLLTLIGGIRSADEASAVDSLAWSRVLLISIAALIFVFGLSRLGLPLSVFLTVLVAASASRSFRVLPGLALAAGVAAGSWIIFAMLLGLPFRATGSWLGM
ncbi:tripartite tricarboxylate transporter TctB family protein [Amaricoccus sp. W119]|uniref:tripartite tricarboxylate transporter TctB family protein n=1 Tax=Amaricoccus sp. W119 TaxID=3391833 RepID=UPI0039A495BF